MSAPIAGAVREAVVTYKRSGETQKPIASSSDVHTFLRELIGDRVCEAFVVLALDARGRPIAWSEIGRGTISSCQVGVSDVLRFALLSGAPGFILAHNHPSGEARPSDDDIRLTQRIVDAARLIGLLTVDHVIVTDERSFSFVDNGVMPIGATP